MSSLRDRLTDCLLATLIGTLAWLAFQRQAPPPVQPVPVPLPQPLPKPPDNKPLRRPRVIGEAKVGGTTSPDGMEEIQTWAPDNLQVKNIGGTDGAGLCVWTSIQLNSRIQNVLQLENLQKWMSHKTGGGWPDRVDKLLPEYCKEQGLPLVDFIQVESNDLEILKLALKSGRPCGVTYSFSPTGRYGGGRVSHMVTLAHLTDKWAAIYDNNYIHNNQVEWMDPQTFLKTYSGGRTGWAVILLAPGTAPSPRNP